MHDRVRTHPRTSDAAAPLAYVRTGALPPRPAVLTALAIFGLVVASVSFLVNVGSLAFHAGVWWLEPEPPKLVRPTAIPYVSIEPYDGDSAGPDGLRRAQRDAVVEHVRQRMPLPDDRAEMLRRLLADVGRRAFPRDIDLTQPSANIIIESGRSPGFDGTGPRASHYFITSRGRVELSDFTATFTLDGTTKPARLVRNAIHDRDAPPRWSAVVIGETLDAWHERSRGKMTAEQASVLADELRQSEASEPASWLVQPAAPRVDFSNDVILYIGGEGLAKWLLPDGRTIARAAAPLGVDPATGVPHVAVAPLVAHYWPGSRGAFAVFVFDGLFSALLAAYLFLAALMLLREQSSAGERHVRFLMCKVPLVVAAALALLWWRHSLARYATMPALASDAASIVLLALLAMLMYPLFLVIVMRTPAARRYFAARGQDPWHPLRGATAAIVGHRMSAPLGIVLAMLTIMHGAFGAWCLNASGGVTGQAAAHLLGVLVSLPIAAVMLGGCIRNARLRTVGVAVVVLCASAVMAQPARGPLSPWAVEDWIARAQGPNADVAADAVRTLARSGDVGQDALLRLLDGPVPPIGIAGVLDAIGHEWFDTDVRWSRPNRPRALRLALEWVEVIEHVDGVRAMAALEALGPDENLEPLLRPLLTAKAESVRQRSAQFLLRINARPMLIIRALERDLGLAGDRQHAALAEALVRLRPASDATLARVLLDVKKPYRPAVATALVEADQPYSPELLAAAERLARREDGGAFGPEIRLMRHTAQGRAKLIDLSFGGLNASNAAREVLSETWPKTEPLMRRLTHEALVDRRAATTAAKRVLTTIHERGDLAPLTDKGDEELRAQALIVMADGEHAQRLGPATLRLTGTVAPPAAPVQWTRATTPGAAGIRVASPPPAWASAALCAATAVAWIALLAMARRHDYK